MDGSVDEMDDLPMADGGGSGPAPPGGAAMRGEVRKLLEQSIDALPEAFRIVFLLRAVEELSVDETAAALGIPAATVRTRFFRARSMLRERLARDFDAALPDAFSFAGERCDRIVEGVLERVESWPRWRCLLQRDHDGDLPPP